MRGKLIVIEGSDGAGKGTQLALLRAYCQSHHIASTQFDFPQYDTFFGDLCGKYLNGDFGDNVSPYFVTLPYALDRWKVKAQIEQESSLGKIVFINRYAPSNAVYHAARLPVSEREKFIDWEFTLEYRELGLPREDSVIYLHVPVSVSQDLIIQKQPRSYLTEGKKKDIHENDIELLKITESLYLDFCQKFPHWVCIECCDGETLLSKEAIQEKIVTELKKRNIF